MLTVKGCPETALFRELSNQVIHSLYNDNSEEDACHLQVIC